MTERIPALEAEIERLEALVADVGRFIEKARRYTDLTELTSELLRMFISKIVVHEKAEKHSRTAEQRVEIYYNHIGAMSMENTVDTQESRTA